MIAARFSSIGWVAGCATAALCCYLASQSVAAERAAVARVDREIAATANDIKRLNTEIAARGRMGQIERWNSEVLALQAPSPGQFVANEVQLASLAGGKPLPLDPAIVASKGAVQTVAYQQTPPAPAATSAQPMLRPATFVRPSTALGGDVAPAIVKASVTRIVAGPLPAQPAPVVKVSITRAAANPVAAKVPTKPAATLSASLLPSDLGSLIAAEKKGARIAHIPADR